MQRICSRPFEGLQKADWKLIKDTDQQQAAGGAASSTGSSPIPVNAQTSPVTPSSMPGTTQTEDSPNTGDYVAQFQAEADARAEAAHTVKFNKDVESLLAENATPTSPAMSPTAAVPSPAAGAPHAPQSWPNPGEAAAISAQAAADKRVLSRNRSLGEEAPNPKHSRASSDTQS